MFPSYKAIMLLVLVLTLIGAKPHCWSLSQVASGPFRTDRLTKSNGCNKEAIMTDFFFIHSFTGSSGYLNYAISFDGSNPDANLITVCSYRQLDQSTQCDARGPGLSLLGTPTLNIECAMNDGPEVWKGYFIQYTDLSKFTIRFAAMYKVNNWRIPWDYSSYSASIIFSLPCNQTTNEPNPCSLPDDKYPLTAGATAIIKPLNPPILALIDRQPRLRIYTGIKPRILLSNVPLAVKTWVMSYIDTCGLFLAINLLVRLKRRFFPPVPPWVPADDGTWIENLRRSRLRSGDLSDARRWMEDPWSDSALGSDVESVSGDQAHIQVAHAGGGGYYGADDEWESASVESANSASDESGYRGSVEDSDSE